MVELRVSNSDQLLAARQESTRSGFEIVPAAIRNSGPKAVESFLCFFARARNRHTGYVYRTAATHFFCWCDETGLALEALRSGHVVSFFEAKRDAWRTSTAATYFQSLKLLFKHLEDDRIIKTSPLIGIERSALFGVAVRRPAKPEEAQKVNLAELKAMVQEIDGSIEDTESFNAMMVVLYPMVIGSMDCDEIAEFTGIPLQDVRIYVSRLRENGCWASDDRICVDEVSMNDNSYMTVEIIFQALCAMGIMNRCDAPDANAESAEAKGEVTDPS